MLNLDGVRSMEGEDEDEGYCIFKNFNFNLYIELHYLKMYIGNCLHSTVRTSAMPS